MAWSATPSSASTASRTPPSTAPSAFSLGEFQIAALQGDSSTTYNHTPFSITYLTNKVNDEAPSPNETPIVIKGFLDGTIKGANQSNVTASFDPTSIPKFQTGLFANELKVLDSPLSLVPSSSGGLTTRSAGRCDPDDQPDPQPRRLAVPDDAGGSRAAAPAPCRAAGLIRPPGALVRSRVASRRSPRSPSTPRGSVGALTGRFARAWLTPSCRWAPLRGPLAPCARRRVAWTACPPVTLVPHRALVGRPPVPPRHLTGAIREGVWSPGGGGRQ